MRQCDKCKEFNYPAFGGDYKECKCKLFKIVDECGDDYKVWSGSLHSAALKYAKTSNENGDYYLMNECIVIEIDGKEWSISAEPDIHYSARPIIKL